MLRQFVVNAFESGPFTGNPAAVVPLERWLPEAQMQAIAAQNNLSETAFFVSAEERTALRWFTPTCEIGLCGHATLASGHVILAELQDPRDQVLFDTAAGTLSVRRVGTDLALRLRASTGLVELDPAAKAALLAACALDRGEAFGYGGAALVVIAGGERAVERVNATSTKLQNLPYEMVTVTSAGSPPYDVVSRVFAPRVGIPEDPVTGAAHCALIPFWSGKIGRRRLSFRQASARGGVLQGEWLEDRGEVELIGSCRTFSRGVLEI